MKKRADRLERKHLHELVLMTGAMALLLTVMVFMRVGAPSVVRAAYVAVTATYDPFYAGQYTYVRATGSNADQCVIYYNYSWGSPPISGQSCGSTGCSVSAYGNNIAAYVGPVSSPATYGAYCINSGPWNSGYIETTVTLYPSDPCPVSNFGSPWNSNSYLIYSGGRGSISNWYGRYCVTNYSGNAIYIPMATPTEWNNFFARASAIGIGISSY